MKVLITGADGFIGRQVIDKILKYDVRIIATSHDINNAKKCNWYGKIEYRECNLNFENDNYYLFFDKPDLLIHLAWEGLPNYKELFHIEKNLFSNYRFIKNLVSNGLTDIAVVGTCLEYGMRNGCLSEELHPDPKVPYAIAKNTLRECIDQLKKHHDFNSKWIRLFYMYGEGQSQNSIIEQLKEALKNNLEYFNMSGGEQLRDYLPVEKVAEYITKISLDNTFSGVVNCCSGNPISIRRFVEDYLKNNNKSIKLNLGHYPYTDYEPMAFWGDTTKLNKILMEYNSK